MNGLLAQVFVLSLASMFNPSLLAALTVMMLLPNPRRLMVGYLIGAYLTSITVGLVVVFSLHGSSATSAAQNTIGPGLDILFGLLLLTVAVVLATGRDQPLQERRRKKKEAKLKAKQEAGKPTESLPLRLLGKGDPRVAFAVGMILSFPGASYLTALDKIAKDNPGTTQTVLLVVAFCLIELLLLEVPLLGFVFAPDQTADRVAGFRSWMARKGRTVVVVGAILIGGWLVIKGLINL